MEEQRETISHSNRGVAVAVGLVIVALIGWAVATRPAVPTPTPTPTPPTTIPSPRTRVPIPVGTDEAWWAAELAEGESEGVAASLAEGVVVLLTSFEATGDGRPPVVRRIDPVGERVFWTATGRIGADWRVGDPIVADGVLVIGDALDDPTLNGPTSGGHLLGLDTLSGELLWSTKFDAGLERGTRSLAKLIIDGRSVLFAQTPDRRLARINPLSGAIEWQTSLAWGPIVGTQNTVEYGPLLEVEAPQGLALLDPETGEVVDLVLGSSSLTPLVPVRSIVGLTNGAAQVERRDLGDDAILLSWSFPEGSPRRAPGLALVNADGDVLWQNEGRVGTSWHSFRTGGTGQSSRTFSLDGVVIKADVADDNPAQGALVAFDAMTGNRLWVSQFRVPVESASGSGVVSLHLRSGGVALVARADGLGLIRVSPFTGSPLWSADIPAGRVVGSVRRPDGSEAIAVVTDTENLFLDVDSGDLVPLNGP